MTQHDKYFIMLASTGKKEKEKQFELRKGHRKQKDSDSGRKSSWVWLKVEGDYTQTRQIYSVKAETPSLDYNLVKNEAGPGLSLV